MNKRRRKKEAKKLAKAFWGRVPFWEFNTGNTLRFRGAYSVPLSDMSTITKGVKWENFTLAGMHMDWPEDEPLPARSAAPEWYDRRESQQ